MIVLGLVTVSIFWSDPSKASTNTAACDTHQVNGGDQAFLMNLNTPLEFGGTVYNGNIYVSPKGTITFGNGDYTFWDYPATPSISIGSWDYHAFPNTSSPGVWNPGWGLGKDLYVKYGSTATSICVDWKVMLWGQSSGEPIYIRMIAEVDPVNYTWTPTYQVSSNAPAGARYGVRYVQNGPVLPLTIQTITTPPESNPVVPPAPEPEPTPEPTPEPSPEPSPQPSPEPSPTPEPTPTPVEPTPSPEPSPVVPVVPEPQPSIPVTPEPERPLEPEPQPTTPPQPEETEQPEEPATEPEEPVEELSPIEPEPIEPPVIEPTEESITSAEELPEEISPELLMQIDLSEIVPTELSEAQVEALIEAALETFETAEKGSEKYLQALEALMVAAQSDDLQLPTELAAIPLLGDIAGAALEMFNNLGNVGADMSPQVRETAEDIVVVSVIVTQVVAVTAIGAMASTSIRRP